MYSTSPQQKIKAIWVSRLGIHEYQINYTPRKPPQDAIILQSEYIEEIKETLHFYIYKDVLPEWFIGIAKQVK